MADNDETPLLGGGATSPAPLKWPHYLGIVLLALYTVSALMSSLASVWTFVAGLLLVVALFHGAHKFYARHAPRTALPRRFIVSQMTLGAFIAPIGAALVSLVAILALLIPTVLTLALAIAVFSTKYPDAMEAFAESMEQFDARASLVRHASPAGAANLMHAASALPGMAVRHVRHAGHYQQHDNVYQHGGAFGGSDIGPGTVWQRMVDAGAAPMDMAALLFVLALIFVAFVLCAAVAVNAAREFARWKLFKRFTVLSCEAGADDATIAKTIGVRGVVLTAMVGAFGMAFAGALSGLMAVSTASRPDEELAHFLPSYTPGFYAALVFLPNVLLDVAVFVGSMLYVGTAYAEKTVLDDNSVDMRKAWTTSVVYNLALSVLSVGTPGPSTPGPSPVAVFLIVTLLRAAVTMKFSKRARAKFVAACAAEDLSSVQGQEQVEEA